MKRVIKAENIYGMARIGYLGKNGKEELEVYINTNDNGENPHVHVRHPKNWDDFHTCIRIDKAEYFLHGDKQDTLNAGQKKMFVKFMNQMVGGKFAGLIWDLCVFEWNRNNERTPMEEDIDMPDYNLL